MLENLNRDVQVLNSRLLVEKCKSLYDFTDQITSHSFEHFIRGDFLKNILDRLDSYSHIMEISARGHCKSSRLYYEVIKEMATTKKYKKTFYFSYHQGMAVYHIKEIREIIRNNPLLRDVLIDNKPFSETILDYTNHFGARYHCQPHGILTFSRGLHTNHTIYIDDALSDPSNILDPLLIFKINTIVKKQILSIANPVEGARIRVVGTPMTGEDFYMDEGLLKRYKKTVSPAWNDKKVPVWPERFSQADLEFHLNDLGKNIFDQEYLCIPAYARETYLDPDDLEKCFYDGKYDKEDTYTFRAGWDPAKKVHSSHFSVFAVNSSGERFQVYHEFWDGVDYTKQLETIRHYIEKFEIVEVLADNSNGSLTGLSELESWPREIKPVFLTPKKRESMASIMDSAITAGSIRFLQDERQKKHLLAVTKDKLKAIITDDGAGRTGHGDAFWSNALALYNENQTINRGIIVLNI